MNGTYDWINEAASRALEAISFQPPERQAEVIAQIIEEEWETSIADAVPVDLGAMLDEAAGQRKVAEATLIRCRKGWVNAMELGILPERYHPEAESIVQEITTALVKMESKEAIR